MNQELIDKRWNLTRKELKRFQTWYKKQNKKIQDKIQEIISYYDISYNDLNKIIKTSDKERLNRKIEEWQELGIYNGYFKYRIEELNKYNINYRELIEILLYGAFMEELQDIDTEINNLFKNVSQDCYNQGRNDLEKSEEKISHSFLDTFSCTLIDGIIFADYLNALYLTNAQEIQKQYLISLQQDKKLDVYSEVMQRRFDKQRNRLISVNDGKYSGGLDKYVTALGNMAYLEASNGYNVEVKFISDHCEHVTEMCAYMDGMILNTEKRNVFKRPYGDSVKDLALQEIDIMGLVIGINQPPITKHFHYCHSTLTYLVDKSADELREIICPNSDIPNFIGKKKKGNYSYEEIIELANQVKYMADKYIEIPSKWSGNIVINNSRGSGKMWSCDITTRNDTSAHELLHEILHSKSISYYSPNDFFENPAFEEIPVQFLTQEISMKEGIELINSRYDKMTEKLRIINKECKIENTDYLFAKKLFEIPFNERYDWLINKVKKKSNITKLVDEIKEDNLWKEKYKK